MKNLIVFIILINIILVTLVTESYGKKPNRKSLYTVLVRNENSSIETFDGGLSYQFINTNKAKEALETKSQSLKNKVPNFQTGFIKLFPNPVESFATLVFELKEDALIDIYTIDNFQNKQIHFSGLKENGIQEVQINFEDVHKGLVFVYLEINGILSVYKVIKD
ncbi:MAG: hypothetical protein RO257_16650 [Candidatus Kapabacteria bacterium]|nr:hypothetical protein [Candidatus Kapabacteria bacterium]